MFKVGQLVAYCESWPTFRIITIERVAKVGKRDVKLLDGGRHDRFKLSGETWDTGTYRWRCIKPLTKTLLSQAFAAGIPSASLALGAVLPEDETKGGV